MRFNKFRFGNDFRISSPGGSERTSTFNSQILKRIESIMTARFQMHNLYVDGFVTETVS